jgi:hypothetical protein
MKKRKLKKLSLNRETLLDLEPRDLKAAGGAAGCFTRATCLSVACATANLTKTCATCVVTQCSQPITAVGC